MNSLAWILCLLRRMFTSLRHYRARSEFFSTPLLLTRAKLCDWLHSTGENVQEFEEHHRPGCAAS